MIPVPDQTNNVGQESNFPSNSKPGGVTQVSCYYKKHNCHDDIQNFWNENRKILH